LAYFDTKYLVTSSNGRIYLIDISTGECTIVWTHPTIPPADIRTGSIVGNSNGSLIFAYFKRTTSPWNGGL